MHRRLRALAVLTAVGLTALVVVGWTGTFGGATTTVWVFAHPDDETLAAAGAMVERGPGEHIVLLLTSGGSTSVVGEPGYPATPSRMRDARERETRAALALIGMDDVRFAGLPDGAVTATDAAAAVRGVIDAEAAGEDVVVRTHSIDDRYEPYGDCGHPDHCATARALGSLHRQGEVDDLRGYRLGHLFGGPVGGTCATLDRVAARAKAQMRRAYTLRDPSVGRYGVAARSVPGPWEATERQPECYDTPSAVGESAPATGAAGAATARHTRSLVELVPAA